MARVAYACGTCGEQGDSQGEIVHHAECKNKFNTVKICTKSGKHPHDSGK